MEDVKLGFKRCMKSALRRVGRDRIIAVANCRKAALLEFMWKKSGIATWPELKKLWDDDLGQRKDFFGRFLKLMVEEGLVKHPVRGLYLITPKGAAFIGRKHPVEELSEVRRLIMEAANIGDVTVEELLKEALLKLDDYLINQRQFWGWEE